MPKVLEGLLISTDKTKLDVDYIHQVLSHSYWAKGIPVEVIRKSIEGSLCFGIYDHDNQVGFARVITDKATFAYLADVFVDQGYRHQGIAKTLMRSILAEPELQGLRRFMLATRDAHGLYRQFGFEPLTNPQYMMQIHKPDLYESMA